MRFETRFGWSLVIVVVCVIVLAIVGKLTGRWDEQQPPPSQSSPQ